MPKNANKNIPTWKNKKTNFTKITKYKIYILSKY